MGHECRQELVCNRLMERIPALENQVGLRIIGHPLGKKALKNVPPVCVLEKRPVIAPRNALIKQIHRSFEPYRNSVSCNFSSGLGRKHGASASRQNLGAGLQQPPDHALFAFAEVCLAMDAENVFHRHARGLFDRRIRVVERKIEGESQAPPDGRLPRTHHPGKDDALRAERILQSAGRWLRQSACRVYRHGLFALHFGKIYKGAIYAFRASLTTGAKNGSPIGNKTGPEATMPTLIRFLTVVGLLAGLFYGSMFVLANFFEPQQHEMTKSIRDAKVK
jgi:hypothetical protein